MMKNFYLALLLFPFFVSCSGYDSGSTQRRTQQIETAPEPEIPIEPELPVEPELPQTIVPIPQIELEQDIVNCDQSSLCQQETIQGQNEALKINSVIIANSDLLSIQDVSQAISAKFSISNIDYSNIDYVSYKYIKKDYLGSTMVESIEQTIDTDDVYYYIPIHISSLGSGIMNSAPHEKNILKIKIKTASDQKTYNYEIEFSMLSTYDQPVLISRDTTIIDEPYYLMDEDKPSFVIDKVLLTNTLPYAVTISGSIDVINETVAILSKAKKQQHKTFVPKPSNYPWDQYKMTTSTILSYHKAVATPYFRLLITKNNTQEELQLLANNSNNFTTLSFNNVTIEANQSISMDLVIDVSINNSIIGTHGQVKLFEGHTICNNVTLTSKCTCYYYTGDINTNNNLYYGMMGCGAAMLMFDSEYYPNCPQPNACVQKHLNVANYPEELLTLIGRHHLTNTNYSINTWLKNYENYQPIGSSTKNMDPIEVIKGTVNYGVINNGTAYSGYIPGVL